MALTDLVIWLSNRRTTGVLTVDRGTVRKTFTVENGMCVRASSTDKREAFGQFLVSGNLITEDQLQRAFGVQEETHVLLGKILVMIGVVRERDVVTTLEFHLREAMMDAMRWDAGVFVLEKRSAPRTRPEIEVNVPLIEIHREDARRTALWERFRKVFSSNAMVLSVNEQSLRQPPEPGSMEARILTYALAGMSIEAMALEMHAPDFQIFSHLHELYTRGIVEPREPSGRCSDPAPFEDFEFDITEDSDFGAIAQKAFEEKDYVTALSHAQAGARSTPGDSHLGALGRSAEAKIAEQLERELPKVDSVPRLLRSVEEIMLERKLNSKERYIVTRVDGSRSIRSIMHVSPMRDIDALAIFRKLQTEGFIAVG